MVAPDFSVGNPNGGASNLLPRGDRMMRPDIAKPQISIEQGAWGFADFRANKTTYTLDDSEAEFESPMKTPADRVIGTTGIASCIGFMIVASDCALVAHFSPGGVEDDFEDVALRFKARLLGGWAWVIAPTSIDGQPVQPGPADEPPSTWDDMVKLGVLLSKQMGLSKDRVVVKRYADLPEPKGMNQEAMAAFLVEANKNGRGTVVVDGRASPEAAPKVYAWDFQLA
ncbi:hypothetical protein MMC19_004301 [Ptychographa xylographoides]|nr:hypothetical protein [Ptychographa xylographoides]